MTETGGPAWRETIFWPFAQMSRHGRGSVLRTRVESETYSATYFDPRGAQDLYFPVPDTPYLKVSAVADDNGRAFNFAIGFIFPYPLPIRCIDGVKYAA